MTRIQVRRDTSANWTKNNPVLASGEPAYETDTGKFKIGDGSKNYTALPYQGGGGGTTDSYTKSETDALLSEKNDNIFDIGKFTVVGSPTITDDGIASGFSTSDYLRKDFDSVINLKTQTLEIETEFIFKGVANLWFMNTDYWRARLRVENSSVLVYFSTSLVIGTNIGVSANVGDLIKAKVKLSPNGNELKVYINGAFANSKTSTFTADTDLYNKVSSIALGGCYNAVEITNTNIDLKHFSITVDGKEVFNGLMSSTKPIYDAIKDNNTKLSKFKTETSTDFSAVNSALNEKANLSDLANYVPLVTYNELLARVEALENK